MAQWIIILGGPELESARQGLVDIPSLGAPRLEEAGKIVVATRGRERVEVMLEDFPETLREYPKVELQPFARQLDGASIALRVLYYRGTTLLGEILEHLETPGVAAVVDNDHGVIKPIAEVLEEGIASFLASRGGGLSSRVISPFRKDPG